MHAVSKCRLTLSLNFINKLKSVSDFSSPPCIETRRECENFNRNRAFFLLHLSEFLNFKEKREHVLLTLSRLEHRIVLSWLTLQRYTRKMFPGKFTQRHQAQQQRANWLLSHTENFPMLNANSMNVQINVSNEPNNTQCWKMCRLSSTFCPLPIWRGEMSRYKRNKMREISLFCEPIMAGHKREYFVVRRDNIFANLSCS